MSAAAEPLIAMTVADRIRPRLRNLVSKILYGSGVNRQAKARARIGLVIIAFAAVY